jgi:hypothetical protein
MKGCNGCLYGKNIYVDYNGWIELLDIEKIKCELLEKEVKRPTCGCENFKEWDGFKKWRSEHGF